jgi:CheY-like chemotaxis protein
LKFTASGEVKVRAERAAIDRIRISVSDTGPGISEADLPKIFEEFRQVGRAAHSARSGTGLGLAITRRLVELLGGEISVASRVGEGSVFAITLPFEIEGRAISAAENEPPMADPERTALVIDSDPASLYLMKKYLVESGYSVAATDDSARGIEIARLAGPAVVTIDLDQLEDGLSLLETIARDNAERSQKSRAIVVLASDADLEAAARHAGATVFLGKPLERDYLISMIERATLPKTGCVLVVDDDDDALALVLAMLEESSYEVETARDGREALEVISQKLPDAIVLDLMLPEMDGFEVVHRLSVNAGWRATPVILLTARDLSHEERRALDTGTTRIIQKGSFTRDELLAELSLAIGKRAESAAS